ncbi:MAG: serine protease [Polyangiaceae bacterium]
MLGQPERSELPDGLSSPLRLAIRLGALVALTSLVGCSGAQGSLAGAPQPAAPEAVVRVCFVRDEPTGGATDEFCSGTGVVIDPRGYVLTAFHVVGLLWPSNGHPIGWSWADDGYHPEVRFAATERARADKHVRAKLLRGEVNLDLALLHIEGDAEARGPFPSIPLRPASEPLHLGEPISASGYMLAFETVHRSFGRIAGLDVNRRDELAWVVTDAPFHFGMSGGAVVDADGRLIGLPLKIYAPHLDEVPVSLARPVERMPSSWRDGLAHGELTGVEIQGIGDLSSAAALTLAGDDALSGNETRYFRMQPWRGGVVRTEPADTDLVVLDGFGAETRSGHGEIELLPDELAEATLAIVWTVRDRAVEARVSFDAGAKGKDPLPSRTLQLSFETSGAPKNGAFVVLEPGASTSDWLVYLSNHDASAPPPGEFVRGRFTGNSAVSIPNAVLGRRYPLVVVPDTGTTLVTSILPASGDGPQRAIQLPP